MLKKIVEYDYERGILTSLVWLDFQWMDEYLKWNPADYEGITQIQLPPHKLWTPDIFLFNDVTGHFGDDLMRGRPYLVIENNGDVRWIPPMVLKTVCEHDNQEESCDLKFGPWGLHRQHFVGSLRDPGVQEGDNVRLLCQPLRRHHLHHQVPQERKDVFYVQSQGMGTVKYFNCSQ